MEDNISQLPPPKKRTPKQLARAYMQGEIQEDEVAHGKGGVYQAMRLASSAKAEVAAMTALKYLSDLAGVENDVDADATITVTLAPIGNDGAGNIVKLPLAG